MDIKLLKKIGNVDQLAGIRETLLLRGRGEQIHMAEFYNAAGLRFSVVPDRGMDIYDLSYKGVNFSFQSKNGLTSPQAFDAEEGTFAEQWSGGMLVTCGLDNVGEYCENKGVYPVHGRYSFMPAKNFGTETYWKNEDYILRARGEVHQTKMYGRHLSNRRMIETGLWNKTIKIHDIITNFEAEDEPFMLLYHWNFGYPLLDEDSFVKVSSQQVEPQNDHSTEPTKMKLPVDGAEEELFLHRSRSEVGMGMLWNEHLHLGAYVKYDRAHLPHMMEWKMMKSHDYVLALEPCNTRGWNRAEALEKDAIAVLPAYSSIEIELEMGILDGEKEINRCREKIEKMQGERN